MQCIDLPWRFTEPILQDCAGFTPLMIAASKPWNLAMVQLLLSNAAEPVIANAAGQTPLLLAECVGESPGHDACAALLREYSNATADSVAFCSEPEAADSLDPCVQHDAPPTFTETAGPSKFSQPTVDEHAAGPVADARPPQGPMRHPVEDTRPIPNADGDSDTGVEDSDVPGGPAPRVLTVQKLSDERRREWKVRRARKGVPQGDWS